MDEDSVNASNSIFILSGVSGAANAAERFLRHRGFDVESSTDPEAAIAATLARKRDYILIAADHPEVALLETARLMTTCVRCAIILYADEKDHAIAPLAQAIGAQYCLSSALSGPAVERAIRKIERDTGRSDSARASSVVIPLFDQSTSAQPWSKAQRSAIFRRGAEAALRESVWADEAAAIHVDMQRSRKLGTVTRLGCIDVQCESFSGYLLVAWAQAGMLETMVLAKIRAYLIVFLFEHGDDISASGLTNLCVREVDFQEWALAKALFLRRSIHEGFEIALASFAGLLPRASIETATDPEMASVSIDEIEGDAIVEFDLFLHLQANDKYILYTPRGGRFYAKQKERLKSSGISRVHFRIFEEADLERHRLQRHFNRQIVELGS